jgi:beta-mannosidase
LTLPDPGLTLTQEQERLRLRVERPAKGVWLSAGDGITWSDNMVDLLPGDEQMVVVRGLGGHQVYAQWLQ